MNYGGTCVQPNSMISFLHCLAQKGTNDPKIAMTVKHQTNQYILESENNIVLFE